MDDVVSARGVLKRWENKKSRPQLSATAFAYLTAPGSSVDAERAISQGRLAANHLQHNVSSETFNAKMVLGSWYSTPLVPSVDVMGSIISGERSRIDK
ncbi:hypothetical protein FRC02_005380 [Tulasnella sp. 418]|nr:hypothetical protein FRC02_005380 [Tulasnella sp. 418]